MMTDKGKRVELELTGEMLKRNDTIDNAVQDCICTLAEKEIDWNMEIIEDVTDAIVDSCFFMAFRSVTRGS